MQGPRPRILRHEGLTPLQLDAVRALEHSLWLRGISRRGDVAEVPLTVGHVQRMLRHTSARRKGRDHARRCIAALVELGVIVDTGRVLTPTRQPGDGRSRWWRVFEVTTISGWLQKRTIILNKPQAAHEPGPPSPSPSESPSGSSSRRGARRSASLCRWMKSQGLVQKVQKVAYGSVQAAFAAHGPP